jgi:hypothetical protein
MNAPYAPEPVRSRLEDALADEGHPAYGQVATLDEDGIIQVRTVHLRSVSERASLGFSTHVRSAKWRQLARNPSLSGCYFDAHRLVQFRWSGRAELVEASRADGGDRALLARMWRQVREDLRKAYWMDHEGLKAGEPFPEGIDLDRACPNMGTVVCHPDRWDVLEIVEEDYRRDRRVLYTLRGDSWISRPVSLLHS